MQKFSAPKGTKDILPADTVRWQFVEDTAREVLSRYGYREIRTPHFEHSEVFCRSIGEETDVVSKEMYTFSDKKGRSMTLRPEGTAGVCRALIEAGTLNETLPVKVYYSGSNFRYEQPQDGRQREFNQIGAECFGAAAPAIDAEMIALLCRLFTSFGLKNTRMFISSLGCSECREVFRKNLISYINLQSETLCEDCRRRSETNPLRILDCKNSQCASIVSSAPSMLDFLCNECDEHFKTTKKYLDDIGIEYNIDRHLVRGLDYYSKTVFELKHTGAGAAKTLAGGGRYDKLVKTLGGPDVCGIGFAFGVERLMLCLADENVDLSAYNMPPKLYIASASDECLAYCLSLTIRLRDAGISVICTVGNKKLKVQLKEAQHIGCIHCTVIGEDELSSQTVKIRNMLSGDEQYVEISSLEKFLKA